MFSLNHFTQHICFFLWFSQRFSHAHKSKKFCLPACAPLFCETSDCLMLYPLYISRSYMWSLRYRASGQLINTHTYTHIYITVQMEFSVCSMLPSCSKGAVRVLNSESFGKLSSKCSFLRNFLILSPKILVANSVFFKEP